MFHKYSFNFNPVPEGYPDYCADINARLPASKDRRAQMRSITSTSSGPLTASTNPTNQIANKNMQNNNRRNSKPIQANQVKRNISLNEYRKKKFEENNPIKGKPWDQIDTNDPFDDNDNNGNAPF